MREWATPQDPAPARGTAARRRRLQQRNRAAARTVDADDFTGDRYRQMARHVPRAASLVLDVGSHTGIGGAALASARPAVQVVGLDLLPECVAGLPPSYRSGICADATVLPFRDECFDVVVAAEVIEHLPAADVDPFLCEVQRVLRVGGRVILTTPNPGYLRNRLRGHSVLGGAHLTQQDAAVLRLRLRLHGFRRVRIRGTGRVSRYLGRRFPLRSVYGAYCSVADKW